MKRTYRAALLDGPTLTFTAPASREVNYAIAVKRAGRPAEVVAVARSWRGAQRVVRSCWRIPTLEMSYISPAVEVL